MFAGDENDGRVRPGTLSKIIDPSARTIQRFLFTAIVAYDSALGPSVVGHGDCAEALLPGRVPGLQADICLANPDMLLHEVDPDSGNGLI